MYTIYMTKANKIILFVVATVLVFGIVYMLTSSSDKSDKSAVTSTASNPSTSTKVEMPNMNATTETPASNQETVSPVEEVKKDTAVTASSNKYITINDYNSDKQQYTDNKKVLFFHASWCPVCQGIEKEINADPARIPTGTTIIKTDYDSNTDLRKKYGITYQYTFVQIDNEGNQLKKWSATSLDKALNSVQ